ncbi:MAG: PAS domain S-box protein, partial [Oscillochloris sp.]|nr:PAS domain S-box protein [Oscillochloris sp.]
ETIRSLATDEEEAKLIMQFGMGACLILPLIASGRTLGVLVLTNDRLGRPLSADDLALFSQLTLTLALMIDNLRLTSAVHLAVTERERLQKAFHDGEAIFYTIFNSGEIGLVLVDPQQNLIIPNPAFQRMVGYTAEELNEHTIYAISHPEDIVYERKLMAELRSGIRSDYRIEKRYIHKDGHEVITQLTLTALRSDDGTIRWVVAIVEDIRTRKRVEEALRASEARYRSLIEDQEDLVVRIVPDGTRTFVNDAYCRHLTMSREQLIGTSIYDLLHPDDLEQMREQIAIYARGEKPKIGLSRGLRPNDSICWYEWTGCGIFNSAGTLIEVQLVGRDVTERHLAVVERIALERKLLEAQKLESLGVLAGGIAHDFNNILTTVLGHAELALLDLPAQHKIRESLTTIIDGAQRAADLTRQILAYSGKGRTMLQLVNLNQIIQTMEHLLRAAVPMSSRLHILSTPDLPRIKADPAQLRQLVLNLVVNAAEALHTISGNVIVATGSTYLNRSELNQLNFGSELPPGTYVYLMIDDDGCGMTSDTLNRIFDPFFSTKFTGRGLGLAAVQGIIRSHSGAVKVTSQLNAGTTVMIWLPATTTDEILS